MIDEDAEEAAGDWGEQIQQKLSSAALQVAVSVCDGESIEGWPRKDDAPPLPAHV